jgi:replicative DNA helicase
MDAMSLTHGRTIEGHASGNGAAATPTGHPPASETREQRIAEIRAGIDVIRALVRCFEIRVLGVPGKGRPYTASGVFVDSERAAVAAFAYEHKQAAGIYITLNELDGGCFARSPDKITPYQETTTSDSDVRRLRWLFLDCDPHRPAGVGSTAKQLAAAQRLADDCQDMLGEEHNWPNPVKMCSGNGAYLLYRIDLPVEPETIKLVKNVVESLRTTTDNMYVPDEFRGASIDVKTFNPARIARLAGTTNRKGHPTAEQPHRRAKILYRPDELEIVTREQLEEVISSAQARTVSSNGTPSSPPHTSNGTAAHKPSKNGEYNHRLIVAAWLRDRGVPFREKDHKAADGRTVYILDQCPFDPNHGGNKEVSIMQAPDGKMSAACMHDSCQGNDWQRFKEKIGPPTPEHYDPPLMRPRSAGKADQQQPEEEKKPAYVLNLIDSAAFATGRYTLEWKVKKLIVSGQPVVIGGPRKSLKTSVIVDLAVSLGTGLPFLGVPFFSVPGRTRVALLSGESGEAVLQETALRVCAAKGTDLAGVDVLWGFKLPQLANGEHLAALADGLRKHAVKVLFIDPIYLALLAGLAGKGIDAANLFEMGPLLLDAAQACLDVGCTPILIHHSRKNLAAPFEPMELEDLAFSGVQEFARQWLLISRQEAYEPGSGIHKLWLVAGGSAGQGGQWGLEVDEGQLGDDFTGRRWIINLKGSSETRANAKNDRANRRLRDDTAKVLQAIDLLAIRAGDAYALVGFREARSIASISHDSMTRAVECLVTDGIIERGECEKTVGRRTITVQGVRRCPKTEAKQ